MPRGTLSKQEMIHILLGLKNELYNENIYNWNISPKELAHKYLNKAIDKLDEYSR